MRLFLIVEWKSSVNFVIVNGNMYKAKQRIENRLGLCNNYSSSTEKHD
jgi:hypothetical protein